MRKQSDVRKASMTWVFIDENPYSINDGYFTVNMSPTTGSWSDSPGCYHNNACGISFADGHSEIKKWTDKNIIAKNAPKTATASGGDAVVDRTVAAANIIWMQDRSTYK
jgi:prepilin-type processing-associated H-X9-DG protein